MFERHEAFVTAMMLHAGSTPRAVLRAGLRNQRDHNVEGKVFPVLLDNFFPIITAGDGHCGFHAISWALFNDQNYHFILRLLSSFVIHENWDFFDTLSITFSRQFSVDAMLHHTAATDGNVDSYFENVHAKALSMALRREIFVFLAFVDVNQTFVGLNFEEV